MKNHSVKDDVPFGLWVYIMSDCVLFACLFAVYAVLHTETAGGASGFELFDRPFVLIETLVLLTSSFTCGLAVLFGRKGNKTGVWTSLIATLLLGATFISMELGEFGRFIAAGHDWEASAFLSSFFTLVSTHGLHVFIGSLWLLAILSHLLIRGLTDGVKRGVLYFSLFWHFLDIVWIFIFSFVYLLGTL